MIRSALIAAIVGFGAGSTLGQTPVGKLAKANGWHSDYESARAAARQSNKPLLVIFRCEP